MPSGSNGTAQKLQSLPEVRLVAGARVRVRGGIWRVRYVLPFQSCTIVHLAGVDRTNTGEHRILLDPFDRLEPERQTEAVRVVRKRRWCHALKGLLALEHRWNALRAAACSRVELIPFQLEPALAAVRGLACRFLLADEVGLGKTIQAGLLINELRERGLADRVLILTPAGLRRQWQAELHDRFSIHAAVIDSSVLRQRASFLPAGTNPWLIDDVAIASIDLIKRPDAMRGLGTLMWDVLVIDEAHLAAQAVGRHRAAEALARSARRVVLITATPHAGDADAFNALCRIGGDDDSKLAMFRRSRPEVGLPSKRRVRTLPVNLSPEEMRLHLLLHAYVSAVVREAPHRDRDALLAMAVLMKRALSSPASLRISIARRLQLLANEPADEIQLPLPLSDDSKNEELDDRDAEPCGVLGTPGLIDRPREVAYLQQIAVAAHTVPDGRKLKVLTRLLQRIHEPALIFTEYRDTLQYVARDLAPFGDLAIIHGGLTEAERIQAQAAFTSGAARVLLATDAAGEGLNLQAGCRLVINLELPWNPMRLEQRIGRVDRLGQTRVVHVINLFARGTAEADVFGRLRARLERARQDVGHVNDPLGTLNDQDLTNTIFEADPVIVSHAPDFESRRLPNNSGEGLFQQPAKNQDTVWQPNLREDAVMEARRLSSIRRVASHKAQIDERKALVTTIPANRFRERLTPPALIWIIRAHLVDGNGQLIEQVLVPLLGTAPFSLGEQEPRVLCANVAALLEAARPQLCARALAIATHRLEAIGAGYRHSLGAARARELFMMHAIEANTVGGIPFQTGLFNGRSVRDRDATLRQEGRERDDAAARVNQIDTAGVDALATDPELLLVLLVGSRR